MKLHYIYALYWVNGFTNWYIIKVTCPWQTFLHIISSLGVSYGEGLDAAYNMNYQMEPEICTLGADEYITQASVYISSDASAYPLEFVFGLTFQTTTKTCGPYGQTWGPMQTAYGHRLLYLSGLGGGHLINAITFHFDCDCHSEGQGAGNNM